MITDNDRYQCLEAATAVVENMIDGLTPSGYMRYAPDGRSPFRF